MIYTLNKSISLEQLRSHLKSTFTIEPTDEEVDSVLRVVIDNISEAYSIDHVKKFGDTERIGFSLNYGAALVSALDKDFMGLPIITFKDRDYHILSEELTSAREPHIFIDRIDLQN